MDFERYYLDLFEMLNALCKTIASGKYSQSDTDSLFELTKKNRYPGLFAELSESFGMMMVKVEAREFELEQMIEALKKSNSKLEGYSQSLEQEVSERTLELKEQVDKLGAITKKLMGISRFATKDYTKGSKIIDIDASS